MIVVNQKLCDGIYTVYATIQGYDYSFSSVDYGICVGEMLKKLYVNGSFLDSTLKPIQLISD